MTPRLNISHRVAPRDSIASRWASGTALKTLREMAAAVGSIIMASTRLAVKTLYPTNEPEKIGSQPKVASSGGAT